MNFSKDFPDDFGDLPDDIEYYLSNFLGIRINRPVPMPTERTWRPHTDVFETYEDITVVIDIAGISENYVKIKIDQDFLIVRGIRRETYGHHQKRQYHKMEIDYGPFERIIKLPTRVLDYSAEARIKDGFLVIIIKKGDSSIDFWEIDIN